MHFDARVAKPQADRRTHDKMSLNTSKWNLRRSDVDKRLLPRDKIEPKRIEEDRRLQTQIVPHVWYAEEEI